jgi:hypothetical protein
MTESECREEGVATIARLNCWRELKAVELPDGGASFAPCPQCYPAVEPGEGHGDRLRVSVARLSRSNPMSRRSNAP